MDRRIIKTKKAIRKAFAILIKQKTVENISVTELTNLADIDRRTFYLHYNTIMDIVLEIENEVITELNQQIGKNKNFKITDFFDCLDSIIIKNYDFFKCISSEANRYRMQIICARNLASLLESVFYVDSGLDKDIFDYYCEYVTTGITAIYIKWLTVANEISIDKLREIAITAVKDGWKMITKEN